MRFRIDVSTLGRQALLRTGRAGRCARGRGGRQGKPRRHDHGHRRRQDLQHGGIPEALWSLKRDRGALAGRGAGKSEIEPPAAVGVIPFVHHGRRA